MSNKGPIKKPLLIEKINKDIKEIEGYIPNITQPSIAGKVLKHKRKIKNKKILEYEDGVQLNILQNKLKTENGETYEGTFKKKLKEIYLQKGIYTWPSGQKYLGSFNQKNVFEGYGKLIFNDNAEFESEFSNGVPVKNGTFKKSLNDGTKINVQSNFKYNNKIIFDDKTLIEITKNGEKIYKFFGVFKNGKINREVLINKKMDNNRYAEIRAFFNEGSMNGLLNIKDTKPGNTFQLMGEYKYGFRDGLFKIKDTVNNIKITEEFHDISYATNLMKTILKRQNKVTMKVMIELYRKKLLEIKFNNFAQKIKKYMRLFLKDSFKKLKFYLNQFKYLKMFNQKYNTRYNLDVEIIHLNKIQLGNEGLDLLCKINFLNLIDMSLSEVNISDFSLMKNAQFPKLKILSLGKNNITSIDFINLLPFQQLENLLLGVNSIEDISPLSKFKSNILKALFLLDNKISDLNPLITMDTPNLEELYIGSNIEDLNPLINCKLPKLKQLSLSKNQIKKLAPLIKCNFPNLELLVLSYNKIEKVSSLLKTNFPKLYDISLKSNSLMDINIFTKFPTTFSNLKKLDISKNKFNVGVDDFNIVISSLNKKIKNISY